MVKYDRLTSLIEENARILSVGLHIYEEGHMKRSID